MPRGSHEEMWSSRYDSRPVVRASNRQGHEDRHAGMGVEGEGFNAIVEDLVQALDKLGREGIGEGTECGRRWRMKGDIRQK